MDPATLSEALRTGDGLYLWCRRAVIVLSLVAAVCMMLVGLYQMGLFRHLPEPPLPRLDADRVDAAAEAYNRFRLPMPDAFLGLVSYAVTAALAALGAPDRYERGWWAVVPVVLLAKVLVDAVNAGMLTWEQWAVHRAFCFWCLLAALVTVLSVPTAVPEAVGGVRHLFH